jgi:hypothetical protein
MAKHPVTFFVQMRTDFSLELENICLENAETNENLVVKKYGAFLISRFPKAANSAKWIQANEQEILEFAYVRHDRTIYLDPQLALIPEKKHIQPTAPLLLLFILVSFE